ncbi:hypothetical protein ANN_08840, partial [Periplaneta americana]
VFSLFLLCFLHFQIEASLKDLTCLTEQYQIVSNRTNSLHQVSEQLLADQTKLHDVCEEVGRRLQHFTALDSLSNRLASPTLSVSSETFIDILDCLDQCMEYIGAHVKWRESNAYLARFHHCLSRAVAMVRSHVVEALEHATQQVLAPAAHVPSSIGSAHNTALALYYGKFQASAPRIKPLIAQIEARVSRSPEYQQLLTECHQCYFAQRELLLSSNVTSSVTELSVTHKGDHCSLVRSSCTCLVLVCQDEHQLFYQFFGQPTPLLASYLEGLCTTLYDVLRPFIIHINHLETLAEVCSILRLEMLEDHVQNNRGQSVVLTTPPHSSAEVMESMGLYFHAPQVPSWHVTGTSLPFLCENLYGCEIWTLTLREEQKLRMFENKVLRKIFGSKRDEVTGEWRKVPDIITNIKSRCLRWTRHVALMGESRNAYRVLVGRPERKRPLGRRRHRWEDNIKMDLREVGYDAGPLEAFGRVAWQLLQDVQERLVFRAHCYLQSDILQYRPAPGDLAYPEKLEMMEVEKFKYLRATLTNINDTREEIKHRINMGNACYYSVEKLLLSSLLSKNLKVRIYKTVILPVVLYGCETWTFTLREEHRLRVFENKVLRKIFGAKRDEVAGEWRKLHNAELHALYSSPDLIRNIKSRRLRWAGHVAHMAESRNAYSVLVGRPEGKRRLGRPRRRWEDNIKMDLREVGCDDRDWINLAQDRDRWRAYVRAAMNLRSIAQSLQEQAASSLRRSESRSSLASVGSATSQEVARINNDSGTAIEQPRSRTGSELVQVYLVLYCLKSAP